MNFQSVYNLQHYNGNIYIDAIYFDQFSRREFFKYEGIEFSSVSNSTPNFDFGISDGFIISPISSGQISVNSIQINTSEVTTFNGPGCSRSVVFRSWITENGVVIVMCLAKADITLKMWDRIKGFYSTSTLTRVLKTGESQGTFS